MTGLVTQVISEPEQFYSMKNEWNSLLQKSHTNTIFLTWEWAYTWWEVFGKPGELFIITVKNEQNELFGIAPLFIRRTKYYKFPVKEMTFIGTGHSDRQDFIIAREGMEIVQEIMQKIQENANRWDIVLLDQIPGDSLLKSAAVIENVAKEMELSSSCPYVRIHGNWESYYKSLGKKFHRDIKHKSNRMNRFGEWDFRTEDSIADVSEFIDDMTSTEAKSRKKGSEKTFLEDHANRDFLIRFCWLSLEKGWLDYSTIHINGTRVAYLLGFLYDKKYYAYNMAFQEDFHEASPGKLLLNEKIKWCFGNAESVQEFDFLRGGTYIKSLWTSENRKHVRIVFFNGSVYSNIIRYAVFRIRPRIKKLLKKNQ